MHRDACDAYLAEGRIAELRTLAPGGRVVGKSTMGVGALEVRASRFCCRRLRRVRARARAPRLLPYGPTPSPPPGSPQVMACVPGANGRGPAHEWLRLFEMLVNEGAAPPGTPAALSNEPLLQPGTVRGLSKRYRVGMYDEVQGVACDWSLGLSVGSTLTGAHSSPDTFGHGGSQSSMGFADPEHRLAVVVVTNARPGPKAHYERMYRLATVLYEDLGLAQRLSPSLVGLPAAEMQEVDASLGVDADGPTANQVTVESG